MKSLIYSLFYLIPILLTGCNGDNGLLGAPELGHTITELQVTPPTASVPIGFHQQYQAHAILEDNSVIDITTNPALSWRSSNSAIATIDSTTGIATGVMEGVVTITASGTANGIPFSKTTELTVTNAVVTTLQITPAVDNMPIGFTRKFTAQATLSDGSIIDVTTASVLSWSTSNPAIATIASTTGIATGVTEGVVTITASGTANGTPFSATAELTVTNAIVTSLHITPPVENVPIGFTQNFTAEATLSDFSVIDVTTDPLLSWSSSNSAIATIVSTTGIATGVTEGIVTITASGIANGTPFSATAELTVTSAIITNLQVTPAVNSVPIGYTRDFTAEIIFSDFSVIDVTTNPLLSWSSSNSAIATIDSATGVATGVAEGTVTIIAFGTSSNGTAFSQTAELMVTSAIITNFQLTPSMENVPIGFTRGFTAEIIFSDFSVIDVTTNPLVSWSSSNPAIATMDSTTGIATGVTEGTVIITASGISSNGTVFSQTAELTVTSVVITSFKMKPPVVNVPIGLTQDFTAEIIFSDFSAIDVTANPLVSWSSSNPAIATIDNTTGIATGVAEGVVTITASGISSNGTAFSATAELTVTNAIAVNLEVDPPVGSVPIGLTQDFTAEVTLSDGSPLDVTTASALSWSSSDPTIATIGSMTGISTGVAVGTVTITASGIAHDTLFSATAELTVTNAIAINLEVDPPVGSVPIGLTQDFTAEATLSDGSPIDVTTNPVLSWSSSAPSVATIGRNTGIATGVAEGVVTITASGISSNGTAFSATAELTVTPAILVTVLLDRPGPLLITEYFGEQLHATGVYSDGRTVSFNDSDCSWGSTNTNIPITDGLIAQSTMYGETGEVFATCDTIKSNEVTVNIIQANKSPVIGALTAHEYLIKQSDTNTINFYGGLVIDGVYDTSGTLLAGGREGGDGGNYNDNMVIANIKSLEGKYAGVSGFGSSLNRLNWVESPTTNKHVGATDTGTRTTITVTSQVYGLIFYGTDPIGNGYISGMVVIYK